LLALPVPLEAQYWTGSYYATNTADNCTAFPASSIALGSYTGGLAACETQVTPTGSLAMVAGKPGTGLVLTKPGSGNGGSAMLTVNTGATASGNTCVSATASAASAANLPWLGTNLGARATFGIFKSPLIYRRENY
jgi:MSHA biogenesis protein MshQ